MTERHYLTSIVALILIRECMGTDRVLVADAAKRFEEAREGHSDFMRMLAQDAEGGPDTGLLIANERGNAAARFVRRTFEDDPPDTGETYVLGTEAQGDTNIAMTLQHVFDQMEPPLRQRFKDHVRLCARLAAHPLNEEVALMLDLLDSWEAWELEQQLM